MTLSVKKNAVSALHAIFEKKRHPHSTLISITNGVYRRRWQAKEFLSRRPDSSVEDLLTTKRKLQKELFTYIESMTGKRLNPGICTLVWARRFAAYKRPSLLFTDRARLTTLISDPARPLQIVISGKAHDADAEGQDTVEKIIAFSNTKEVRGRVVYLPDYNITSAEKLTRGADIWLNTPELGKEACGTSGMKASLNGTLQCSIRDGWVDEANWEGRGWSLPEEGTAEALYDFLEHEILPMYYDDPEKWAMRMKSTLELVEDRYTTARMLDDYEKLLYS
jgi:starch phosphorylase